MLIGDKFMFKVTHNILLKNIYKKGLNRFNTLLTQRFGEIEKICFDDKKITEQMLYEKLNDKIMEQYSDIIKDEALCNKEKNILEAKIAYHEENNNNDAKLFYVLLFTILSNFLNIYINSVKGLIPQYLLIDTNSILFLILIVGIFAYIILSNKANWNRSTNISFYTISLRVLDEIEIKIKNEVAAPIENEKKEQVKHISNQNNGNWNISISEDSIFTMVKGAFKSVKFVGKLIGKKKK
jgi:hypothetical protein